MPVDSVDFIRQCQQAIHTSTPLTISLLLQQTTTCNDLRRTAKAHSTSAPASCKAGICAYCRFSLFIIAPEGTTKHRHCLLTFARGAFAAGQPVMPVLLKYRSAHFNLGWGIVYTPWHFFRMCQQYINHLELLPVYKPSQGIAQRATATGQMTLQKGCWHAGMLEAIWAWLVSSSLCGPKCVHVSVISLCQASWANRSPDNTEPRLHKCEGRRRCCLEAHPASSWPAVH